MRARAIVTGAIALACIGCSKKETGAEAPRSEPSTAPPPRPRRESHAANGNDLHFMEIMTAHAPQDAPEPLLVLLHGKGGRPESFLSLWADFTEPARMVALRAPLDSGNGFAWFEHPVDADENVLANAIRPVTERVAQTISDIRARRATWGKPVVIGFSQGAMIAYDLAARHPESADTVYAIAGFLPEPLVPSKLDPNAHYPSLVPVREANDQVIPLAKEDRTIDALRKLGIPTEVHTYQVDHKLYPHMANDMKKVLVGVVRRIAAGERDPPRLS